jgi:hypothetical protein
MPSFYVIRDSLDRGTVYLWCDGQGVICPTCGQSIGWSRESKALDAWTGICAYWCRCLHVAGRAVEGQLRRA